MKRPVVWLFVTLFSGSLHTQNRAFCEMIEQVASPKKTRICLDYGQDRKQAKEIRLENEAGEAEIFSSRAEGLNIMSSLGRRFEQACVKVGGGRVNGTGGTSRTTRYLLSREMDSLADMKTLVDRIKEKESGL